MSVFMAIFVVLAGMGCVMAGRDEGGLVVCPYF